MGRMKMLVYSWCGSKELGYTVATINRRSDT